MRLIAVMNSRGQITLPRKLREELGLTSGTLLAISVARDGRLLVRIKNRKLSELASILTRPGQPTVSIEEMSR